MTENQMDIGQLLQLLEADWLDEEHKKIIKDVVRRTIKLMPDMIEIVEKSIKEMKND